VEFPLAFLSLCTRTGNCQTKIDRAAEAAQSSEGCFSGDVGRFRGN
jgi:hypothetical protein